VPAPTTLARGAHSDYARRLAPQHHATLILPAAHTSGGRSSSFSLPADLLEQARARIATMAMLMTCAFAIDPTLFFGGSIMGRIFGQPLGPEFFKDAPFYLSDAAVVVGSGLFWWVARGRRVSARTLHALGLVFEVAICFVIALRTYWEDYRDIGMLPSLTWAPAVTILFPLIVPAPPRLVLLVSACATAMSPLALFVLQRTGQISVDFDFYLNTTLRGCIAIGFAYMGSKVVYGLGREVAAARELGSYQLEEKLGHGGMGDVWRARHRLLARPAAIKLIRPFAGGPTVTSDAKRRFEREAQATASLRSPHTVNLFDFGVAEDGAFYYVMELLDGLDADALVRRFGPVPPERAVHLLRQVCHSLSEAESLGLIHRDIKPANIFLCRYGEDYDFVKVLDFGLVKGLDSADDDSPTQAPLSRENTVRGTPAFMAPEQALGQAGIDGRADIYALGCVAYWLLSGHLVFSADTPMGYLVQHAQSTPHAASTRTENHIPEALDRLVMACLAKDPADRPPTARDLIERLENLDGAETWTRDDARRWWDLHQPDGRTSRM
jgi:eukaryotic-like serine/threonine-protein kinase